MERLTERKYGEIVSSKRERTQIHCSNFCNNCSQGTGNCDYVREMVEKLAEYEDAEEQGVLLRLPCKEGDKAYHVIEDNCANPPIYISEHEIQDVSAKAVYFADDWWTFKEMPELNAFLSKEEAEQKLASMQKGETE